jgi:hypothetical protein
MTIAISSAKWADLSAQGYLNNPFVAWENLGAATTLSGTAVVTGGDRANSVSGSTYDKWRPDVTTAEALLKFDFGSATSIDFASIGAHNAFTYAASVVIEYSADDVTYTDCGAGSVTPSDNRVIAWRFATVSARYWRFKFTGLTSGDDLSVGVAFLGVELVIPRRFYQGFSPVLTPTDVQLQSNVSVGGHLLGGSVISRGSTISASISNIDASFIRGASWLAFQTAFGEGQGFFFAWRPEKYASDVYYCARSGDVIRPENTGPRDLMSVQIDARVYANG